MTATVIYDHSVRRKRRDHALLGAVTLLLLAAATVCGVLTLAPRPTRQTPNLTVPAAVSTPFARPRTAEVHHPRPAVTLVPPGPLLSGAASSPPGKAQTTALSRNGAGYEILTAAELDGISQAH